MNPKMFKTTIILLMLAGSFYSCQSKNEADLMLTLIGTKWKLAGIVDTGSGTLKRFEPSNCGKCYTLTFDTDSTFKAYSSTNELGGGYIADYSSNSFIVAYFGGTKVGEFDDGYIYARFFEESKVQSFFYKKNALKLFYDGNKNYLLFKQIQP